MKNKHIVVDVETNGPIIGRNSMISFGMVLLQPGLNTGLYKTLKPISNEFVPEALAVSGFTHDETLQFQDPYEVMNETLTWIITNTEDRPILWSDNNGFDASWINWYFLTYCGFNPFGWSSRRIGDVYCGLMGNGYSPWKHLRDTKHTHNPLDDAKGNAEALLKMVDMGFIL